MKLSLILLTLCIQVMIVKSFFHELSMRTYSPPDVILKSSLFGFSISYQAYNKRLLVSAPRADPIGRIYSLDLLSHESNRLPCDELESFNKKFLGKLNHTDWWLGASVTTGSDFFTTCAPRFAEIRSLNNSKKWWANRGACYIQSATGDMTNLPVISNVDRKFGAGDSYVKLMDNFGWSMHVTEPDNSVMVGSPAGGGIARAMLYEEPTSNKQPVLFNRFLPRKQQSQFYFGYSLTSGKFFTENNLYAISTIYGDMGFAKVHFFTPDFFHIFTIVHDQVGSMFGASLCSARLTTGYDSLLVGAPTYAQGRSVDTGAVFVYVPDDEIGATKLILKNTIESQNEGSYFGLALAKLGDMDGDHRDEVAIAAPFEDDGAGAVYIYTGKSLLTQHSTYKQKIKPQGFRAFGLSLTALKDYDKNGCNEISIGAPYSNIVALLHCFASVTVNLKTVFPSLPVNNKTTEDVDFDVYLDVVYPEKPKNITTDVKVTVEITDPNSKFLINDTRKYSYITPLSERKSRYEKKIRVKVFKPQDVESHLLISYRIKAELFEDPRLLSNFQADRVLLSERSVLSIENSEMFRICSGEKGKCVPILVPTLTSSLPNRYIIGSSEQEYFNLSIHNEGDIAIAPCCFIYLNDVNIIKPANNCIISDRVLQCKPAAPLLHGYTWDISFVTLEMRSLTNRNKYINVTYELYSHCNKENDKNVTTEYINLYSDVNHFDLKGQTNPAQVIETTAAEIQAGLKKVEHLYTVTNYGVTNWIGLQYEIEFPDNPHINMNYTTVSVYSESGSTKCEYVYQSFVCEFSLNSRQKAIVHVAIELLKENFENIEEARNVTIESEIYLRTGKYESSSRNSLRLTTIVALKSTKVAIWIIIISSLIGIILLAIIASILYKSGFLRRKNRRKIENLRRSLYRQSQIRNSMRTSLKEVIREKDCEDQDQILYDENIEQENH